MVRSPVCLRDTADFVSLVWMCSGSSISFQPRPLGVDLCRGMGVCAQSRLLGLLLLSLQPALLAAHRVPRDNRRRSRGGFEVEHLAAPKWRNAATTSTCMRTHEMVWAQSVEERSVRLLLRK